MTPPVAPGPGFYLVCRPELSLASWRHDRCQLYFVVSRYAVFISDCYGTSSQPWPGHSPAANHLWSPLRSCNVNLIRASAKKPTSVLPVELPFSVLGQALELAAKEQQPMDAYYYGCGNDSGHYWWAPNDRPDPLLNAYKTPEDRMRPLGSPFGVEVDCGVQPKTEPYQHQGPCRIETRDGWTVMAWWDRSVDKRYNSCSAFVHRGEHAFPEMLKLLKSEFPWVFNRLRFELTYLHGASPQRARD